jgi:hypothetical protein
MFAEAEVLMIWLPQIFETIAAGRQHRTVRLRSRIPNSLVPAASGKLAGSTSGLGAGRVKTRLRIPKLLSTNSD